MSDSVGTTFRGKRRYHSLLETRVPLPPFLSPRRILSSLSFDREKIVGKFLATGKKGFWPTASVRRFTKCPTFTARLREENLQELISQSFSNRASIKLSFRNRNLWKELARILSIRAIVQTAPRGFAILDIELTLPRNNDSEKSFFETCLRSPSYFVSKYDSLQGKRKRYK